jgi:hypothetical protein
MRYKDVLCPECQTESSKSTPNLVKSNRNYLDLRNPDYDEDKRAYLNAVSFEGATRGDGLRKWTAYYWKCAQMWEDHEEEYARRTNMSRLCQRSNPDPEEILPEPDETFHEYLGRVVQEHDGAESTTFEDARLRYIHLLDETWLELVDWSHEPRYKRHVEYTPSSKTSAPYPRGGLEERFSQLCSSR